MGTETQGRSEEPPPKLDEAEEWTYGDPLAPEVRELEASLPRPAAQTSRIGRLLARVEQLTGLRIGRSPSRGS